MKRIMLFSLFIISLFVGCSNVDNQHNVNIPKNCVFIAGVSSSQSNGDLKLTVFIVNDTKNEYTVISGSDWYLIKYVDGVLIYYPEFSFTEHEWESSEPPSIQANNKLLPYSQKVLELLIPESELKLVKVGSPSLTTNDKYIKFINISLPITVLKETDINNKNIYRNSFRNGDTFLINSCAPVN